MARPGKPGPRPAPTALKLVKGERKADRINRNEPTPRDRGVPKPPTYLGREARAVWRRVAAELYERAGFTWWDVDAFAVFCDAVVKHREAAALLSGAGLLVKGARRDGAVVKNPAWQIYRETAALIRAFGAEFGLTPSARSELVAPAGAGGAGAESRRSIIR